MGHALLPLMEHLMLFGHVGADCAGVASLSSGTSAELDYAYASLLMSQASSIAIDVDGCATGGLGSCVLHGGEVPCMCMGAVHLEIGKHNKPGF